MPLLEAKQQSALKLAACFAPDTSLGVTVRNLATKALRIPLLSELLIGRGLRDEIVLPNHERE